VGYAVVIALQSSETLFLLSNQDANSKRIAPFSKKPTSSGDRFSAYLRGCG
jgi:hypothetical protein